MPIFEFQCDDCGTKFEKLLRRAGETEGVECPSCGENHITEQLSTFAAHANGSPKQSAMPSCGSGMCGMPGMCGRN
ncbi:MAG: zinc ribbon domain-containing protein [Bryobacteraceae bacterium]